MKKIKKASVLIVLVFILGVVLVACDAGEPNHILYGTWKEITAPTCTHVGEEIRVSTNGTITQSRYIAALGHDWGDWEIFIPATEDEPGLLREYCKHDSNHYIEREYSLEENNGGGSGEIVIPPPPAIPADGPGVFVIGGYARYISEIKVYAIVKDFEIYCNENAIPRAFIGWRMYDGETLGVVDFCAAVRADNCIDALLGVGNNINSVGNLDGGYVTQKSPSTVTIWNGGVNTDTSRYHAITNNDSLTLAFWEYIHSARAVAILTEPIN
jgi:hypothetical protein